MELELSGVITTQKRRMSIESIFAITFFLPAFVSNLTEILVAFGFPGLMAISHAVLYILDVILLFKAFFRRPDGTVSVVILAALAILMSCLINSDVTGYIFNFESGDISAFLQSNIMTFLLRCVLTIVVFSARLNIYALTEYLKKFSLLVVLMYVAMNIVNFSVYSQNTSYMNNAYMALIPVSLLYIDSLEKKKTVRLLISIFASLLLMVSGSRGAALCIICFIGMYHILSGKMTVKKVATVLIVLSLAIILILNLESILTSLSELFGQIGISTRLIDLINGKGNGIYHLSGRDEIYTNAIHEFEMFGSGLFYDRVLGSGRYVHNFIFEVILNFGYLIGIPILLFLLIRIIRSVVILRRDPKLDAWSALVIVVVCIKYMVSGSYLISQDFWLLMGIVFCADSKNNKKAQSLSR